MVGIPFVAQNCALPGVVEARKCSKQHPFTLTILNPSASRTHQKISETLAQFGIQFKGVRSVDLELVLGISTHHMAGMPINGRVSIAQLHGHQLFTHQESAKRRSLVWHGMC